MTRTLRHPHLVHERLKLNELVVEPVPVMPDVSCVIPAFNEEAGIADCIKQVSEQLYQLVKSYEIIVVDDGSSDATFEQATALIEQHPLRVIRLSRNFGKENALFAGLKKSRGKSVFIVDADLQEPVSYFPEFLAKHRQGYEMIYAYRSNRADEPWAKRFATRIFYGLLDRTTDCDIPRNARDFRLMDRKVVDAICAMREHNRFMKGIYGWVGFRTTAVAMDVVPRQNGHSKFGYRNLFNLAVTGLTSFTTFPLRVWTGVGLVIAFLSLLYAAFIAVRTFVYGADVAGWATLTVAVFFFGGVQLLSIGILGEYLGRVFSEVKARPNYIEAEDVVSDLISPVP